MDALKTLELKTWSGPFAESERHEAIDALESGRVLFFPHLPFVLRAEETPLLTPSLSTGRAKNISLDPSGKLKHESGDANERALLQGMMQRFAGDAVSLVSGLFPNYAERLERARTSYRPVEIAGRKQSPVHDDTRLHVDAFPTRPMRGRRIMRLFSNVHPGTLPRMWNVGEPFADMAAKILPSIKTPPAYQSWINFLTHPSNGLRSPYDNLMLGFHDTAKLDMDYQNATTKTGIAFPPGCTWLCYTDQVMHAALSGQFVLEQTFHLDIAAMADPARAPIRVLEKMTGRTLA
ncbi:MAG TPA: Kdo hydroxylase family protein [Rhizomicrobium sp.]|nr:Kdo hydroxylase family protein [Rhizomicrobium sp.]